MIPKRNIINKIFNFYFHFIVILFLIYCFYGCGSSLDLPSLDESKKSIELYSSRLDSLNRTNVFRKISLPEESDFIVKINMSVLNKILENIAYRRDDDISITFLPTTPLMSEDKSILGIAYTNYLNIEGGFISTNLKKFFFNKFDQNKFYATIEVEGKGNISVSGKYLGIPASVSPEVELYLYEPIVFEIVPTDSGVVILKPQAQTLTLKTKFSADLLGWKVPIYKEVSLELSDILKPISIPVALKSEIPLPVPAKKYGDNQLEFISHELDLRNVRVSANNNIMEFKSYIDFRRKKY